MLDLTWNLSIRILLVILRNKAIQVDICSKFSERSLILLLLRPIILLQINLKKLHLKLFDVLELDKDLDFFINLKLTLVIVTKFNERLVFQVFYIVLIVLVKWDVV